MKMESRTTKNTFLKMDEPPVGCGADEPPDEPPVGFATGGYWAFVVWRDFPPVGLATGGYFATGGY